MRRSILALVLVLGLGATVEAGGDKVDWSQYIEKPGSRPPPKAAVDAPAPGASQARPRAGHAKLKSKSRAKAKARAKHKSKAKAARAKHR